MENGCGASASAFKASDLRGILEYVPQYRDQTFVLAIDGSIIACENFANIVTDIAVLRSLGVNIVVVHGIGQQMREFQAEHGVKLSDIYGTNPVDEATLAAARQISAGVFQRIVDEFAAQEIRCVSTNAVRATEVGIISGVDYLNAGRIEKIDFKTIENLIALGMVPIFTPMATKRDGGICRINSDLLAAELSIGLNASKLIYITETCGLCVGSEKTVAVPIHEVRDMLESRKDDIDPRVLSKVVHSIKALESTCTRRAHILDGRQFACLLNELFDKVGCGTMIYADDYQKIRPATPDDISTIYNLSKISAQTQNLVYRSMEDIERDIGRYFVYEMDGSIVSFVSLLDLGEGCAELAGLHVQPFYQGHDVGSRMVEYVKMKAREGHFKKLFALSTKSAPFFSVCGFREVSADTLPAKRYEKYKNSRRNSRVFLYEVED